MSVYTYPTGDIIEILPNDENLDQLIVIFTKKYICEFYKLNLPGADKYKFIYSNDHYNVKITNGENEIPMKKRELEPFNGPIKLKLKYNFEDIDLAKRLKLNLGIHPIENVYVTPGNKILIKRDDKYRLITHDLKLEFDILYLFIRYVDFIDFNIIFLNHKDHIIDEKKQILAIRGSYLYFTNMQVFNLSNTTYKIVDGKIIIVWGDFEAPVRSTFEPPIKNNKDIITYKYLTHTGNETKVCEPMFSNKFEAIKNLIYYGTKYESIFSIDDKIYVAYTNKLIYTGNYCKFLILSGLLYLIDDKGRYIKYIDANMSPCGTYALKFTYKAGKEIYFADQVSIIKYRFQVEYTYNAIYMGSPVPKWHITGNPIATNIQPSNIPYVGPFSGPPVKAYMIADNVHTLLFRHKSVYLHFDVGVRCSRIEPTSLGLNVFMAGIASPLDCFIDVEIKNVYIMHSKKILANIVEYPNKSSNFPENFKIDRVDLLSVNQQTVTIKHNKDILKLEVHEPLIETSSICVSLYSLDGGMYVIIIGPYAYNATIFKENRGKNTKPALKFESFYD